MAFIISPLQWQFDQMALLGVGSLDASGPHSRSAKNCVAIIGGESLKETHPDLFKPEQSAHHSPLLSHIMPATAKNSKIAKSKQKPQEEQRDESLQAVVLADCFEARFAPFTLERPRKSHVSQFRLLTVPSASKWKLKSSPFREFTIIKSTSDSVGGVMRDLERAEIITGDFVLVSGDVISNISLEPILAKHRARREKDKNAIMTMILREATTGHRSKSQGSRPVFVIDAETERCLQYEELSQRRGGNKYISLDPEILTSTGEIEVREDLIDCRIDICTQDVLLAWSDNFDFTSVRRSFLRGVLKDYETYGKTVHTHVVKNQYAARVKSLRTYNAVSRDITGRWTYPICPDSNLVAGQNYRSARGKNYQEENVSIARSATVQRSIIGSDTRVGDSSSINGSTIGRRCKIGKNVNIEGAYLWDNVSIGDGTSIRQAVIANDTIIGRACKIRPAALVSYNVQIPDNVSLHEGSRVTKGQDSYEAKSSDDDDSDASSAASSHLVYQNHFASSSASSVSTLASSDAELEPPGSSRRGSFRSDPSDDAAENRDFHLEATASILDGLQKDDPADTIILELNGYRMSTNASQHEVRKALVAAFLKRISNLVSGDAMTGKQSMSVREAVRSLLTRYKTLVERTMFDRDAEFKVDQVDFLMLVQKEVAGRPNADQLMLFIANEAYDQDIVEEDGVLQWWEDERSKEGQLVKVRGLTEKFVTYLREAEEDESDEESEEDDEEEQD
ncbi:translation initiation factor eIF-2B epsilon subunit, GEF [Lecanora helva]